MWYKIMINKVSISLEDVASTLRCLAKVISWFFFTVTIYNCHKVVEVICSSTRSAQSMP